MQAILLPVMVMGVLGGGIALLLVGASKKFSVEENPLIDELMEILPGANCGVCGFAGCRAFAEEKVKNPFGDAFCPVGGEKVAKAMAELLGVKIAIQRPMIARLKCSGTNDVSAKVGDYEGIPDCRAAMLLFPGQKICPYGCIGLGSCIRACLFGAITKFNGIVKIDGERCVGCHACVSACPKHLIEMMPKGHIVYVACTSNDRGGQVRTACSAGCIGCKKCEKVCPVGAAVVTDFLCHIHQDKCTQCGKCIEVCPVHVIHILEPAAEKGKTLTAV